MSADVKFRATARRAVVAALDEFKVGQQDRLNQIHRSRPAAFGALPAAYPDRISEPRIAHTGYGIRQRDVQVRVAFVDLVSDNEEVVDRLDELADDWVNWLTARPHLLSLRTVQAPISTDSGEIEMNGVFYAAVFVTLLGQIEENKE